MKSGVLRPVTASVLLCFAMSLHAIEIVGWGELGFLGVLDHKVQFSKAGTYFDYDDNGGQNVLFPFARLSVESAIRERHHLIFLYQPLVIETEEAVDEALLVNETLFEPGTPVRFTYSFPFYRISYLYDFLGESENNFALGLSLQIRNATIAFASLDGEQLSVERDIGPVPALKVRARYAPAERFWLGVEADGIWAPVKYINGSDTDVEGAILDASVRAGYSVSEELDGFLNIRYLGGGAEGTGDDDGPGDGYVKNWLHFLTVSLGFRYDFQLAVR